ncbi:DNA polymerase III subunit beta [Tetragenococcus koreensis]|uniref:Beta sliding clamp n=1 Tax=Tetragenococcus koreensis TaxID=290335 RepID=A0AAN4UC42_9ENTE|nr:DNA polymerase III subunit beta [Tetragenococcus koreensis]MCF1586057.1 DNA polymerase III subunit beta [Tetragenococcus koreensis]MCF1614863.1 DNA polymerase III subunit beta [Tetragenococcus koreensis]MCF1616968.1 DNA polymerase III subunit beta [Tetragenococcus koreensis]MCF1619358.1 DNA polymerase III subunit beta [Tetragenococcus koreensis]MCF1621865.1 DNA polymerase III subunit beta [Tetragenococcus koreensis]
MKVTLNRTSFTQQLQTVQRAISSKTTMPILTGVKIDLSNNGLTLTGSNADISIESFLSSEDEKAQMTVESSGSIVLQARFFSEIIRRLPEDHVTLEVLENNQVEITSGKANFLVNGLDPESYPHLPTVDRQKEIQLPVDMLNKLINETVFSVSQHESRPILTGVHFMLKNQRLLAVATDSHRLSQRIIPLENDNGQFDIVIPGKSLTELSRSLTDEEDTVQISIMENQVLFETKNMKFYSRLLEGKYPDTDRLIPSSFNTEIEFAVPALLAAIERASLLSHESRNNIVRLNISEDSVVLHGNSPEVGKVEEDLKYEKVSGDPLEISFNPDYMKDALRAFGDTTIRISFISAVRPFTLEPTEGQGDFLQLITPVRTN